METSYAVPLAQKYPKDFDSKYKSSTKKKHLERLAVVAKSLKVRKQQVPEEIKKKSINEKR